MTSQGAGLPDWGMADTTPEEEERLQEMEAEAVERKRKRKPFTKEEKEAARDGRALYRETQGQPPAPDAQ